jgi:hypothetical protein
MVHICQTPYALQNTKHHMFTGSHFKRIFVTIARQLEQSKASSLLRIHDHKKKYYSHKKDAAVTCTKQFCHQHDVRYSSKAFNPLILIQANSTNICVSLLPKKISRFLHLEDSLGLLKTLGVYSNPCKCGLVYIEKAQCSSKTRLRKQQWHYLPSKAK